MHLIGSIPIADVSETMHQFGGKPLLPSPVLFALCTLSKLQITTFRISSADVGTIATMMLAVLEPSDKWAPSWLRTTCEVALSKVEILINSRTAEPSAAVASRQEWKRPTCPSSNY